ncbi:MAG: hypothetical protein CMM87_04780 [Rickettsiales bacterium]|nr:hypothetical protein [Rickettsiales bacterium]|tara:strand:+ start:15736 stop:16764 length:1029 start_codon:yes stop_codon:yes gene_type:complete
MLFLLTIIFILVILSAFFSGCETAFTTVSRARIHQLSKENLVNAKTINFLQKQMEKLLGAILLANNFVNILATSIATSIFISFFSEGGIGIATFIMTIVLIIFAEFMPKVYALQHAEKYALLAAPLLKTTFYALKPVVTFIQKFVYWLWKIIGLPAPQTKNALSTRKEITALLEMLQDAQERNDLGMIRGILELSQSTLVSCYKPRNQVMTIDGNRTLDEVMPELLDSPYSRFPVWDDNPEKIIGVVHLRFLTQFLYSEKKGAKKVKELISEPAWTVSKKNSLFHQLQLFKSKHNHMAIVVDTNGAFDGIVTLEDVLEEVVGDITDESDANKNNTSYILKKT